MTAESFGTFSREGVSDLIFSQQGSFTTEEILEQYQQTQAFLKQGPQLGLNDYLHELCEIGYLDLHQGRYTVLKI